jgi:hypothetical protein
MFALNVELRLRRQAARAAKPKNGFCVVPYENEKINEHIAFLNV